MQAFIQQWDYLIVTASNDAQAAAYESQLDIRRELGLLAGVRNILVVPDPGGRRVGSGGSTIHCLGEVLFRELPPQEITDPTAWEEALRRLRVLIVHAGGDSKRLPAYGPCGKIFVPVPGESDSAIGMTLFDRQLPTYLNLPPGKPGSGQVVITAGDVLLSFDPSEVDFGAPGMTGLGCLAPPEQASKHGVYAADIGGRVRKFLQKPSPHEQKQQDAVDRYGQAILDIGVIHFDAPTAVRLMQCFAMKAGDGHLGWTGEMGRAIDEASLDFYREICCAMGTEATSAHHIASARGSGSGWSDALLGRLFESLTSVDFHVQVLPRCGFLHFGTTRQIITSGRDLLRLDRGASRLEACLSINNDVPDEDDLLRGTQAWVEGCLVRGPLTLAGRNVVVGADIEQPLALPEGACLDVLEGVDRRGNRVWFVRCYGVGDSFKTTAEQGATLCNLPIAVWLEQAGATAEDLWDADVPADQRTAWDAKVFPAEPSADGFTGWLWMYDPSQATDAQKDAWRKADRYSLSEIATLADQDAFHARRLRMRAEQLRRSLARLFRIDSEFSARELAFALGKAADRTAWVAQLLTEAQWHYGTGRSAGLEGLVFGRIIHSLGEAVEMLATSDAETLQGVLPGLGEALGEAVTVWLETLELTPDPQMEARRWAQDAKAAAFGYLSRTIVSSGRPVAEHPRSALRADEIVWGRAPARLDLAGGWTDTPPYALEHGGCVINAAVNLNGQPPIHCYARVIPEPVLRIASIDIGTQVQIERIEDLMDYRSPTSGFALAKATLAISGLDPAAACWPDDITLPEMLERFGGGIELTTLAAIPKGSGLGTSSIVGAVILATIQRVMGHTPSQQELFHGVLKLEQALTTGGGWQDQVGGAVDAVKVVRTVPGLVPDPMVHYVPGDVLDPRRNGGCTLLYYTGITRLAKNILQQVVGRYLSRDRQAMQTLRQIHNLPGHVAAAMSRKDLKRFGELVDVAWRLNKQLDPNSSNARIEALLAGVEKHLLGAKLLGAGGGGFLLMVCKSPQDATKVRETLDADPPNELARFFDFDISPDPLTVTVC